MVDVECQYTHLPRHEADYILEYPARGWLESAFICEAHLTITLSLLLETGNRIASVQRLDLAPSRA